MNDNSLTAEELRESLSYDPQTGIFVWVKQPRKILLAMPQAGAIRKDGRRQIGIKGKMHLASRLAWLYVHGKWPTYSVDHINGNKADDRICNLRDVPSKTNSENQRKPQTRNKAGFLGVYKHSQVPGWVAQITVSGKSIYLGLFDQKELAAQAYLNAKRRFHEGNTL